MTGNLLLCQTIPNEFKEFHKRKILVDSGKDWHRNSIFGPSRIINSTSKTDSLVINSRFGVLAFTKARAFYGFGHFTYKNNFHITLKIISMDICILEWLIILTYLNGILVSQEI